LHVTGQTRNRGTVRQNNRRTFGLSVNLLGKEAIWILRDSRELLRCNLGPEVIGRPILLKRVDIP
jgi:hypothetical protein